MFAELYTYIATNPANKINANTIIENATNKQPNGILCIQKNTTPIIKDARLKIKNKVQRTFSKEKVSSTKFIISSLVY